MFKYLKQIILLTIVVQFISCFNSNDKRSDDVIQYLRHPLKLGAPSHVIIGEHITLDFYKAAEKCDTMKKNLQEKLHNFLEDLQKNLTTSNVLNTIVNTIDMQRTQHQIRKLEILSEYFYLAYMDANNFGRSVENFFDISKNESNLLLLKLRNVPSPQGYLSARTKIYLTDYFAEMEYFHTMFSEVVDEALEYIIDTLRISQTTFITYADIQRDIMRNWNFKPDEWCCNNYMDFLQHWSALIFNCAAGHELEAVYDVYAITEVTIKYIMRQLEFRIQRLYNCFIYGNSHLKCRFLRQAEDDFKALFLKLEELQMYYYLQIQGGKAFAHRQSNKNRIIRNSIKISEKGTEVPGIQNKCIPPEFPKQQMTFSLKSCFYFPESD